MYDPQRHPISPLVPAPYNYLCAKVKKSTLAPPNCRTECRKWPYGKNSHVRSALFFSGYMFYVVKIGHLCQHQLKSTVDVASVCMLLRTDSTYPTPLVQGAVSPINIQTVSAPNMTPIWQKLYGSTTINLHQPDQAS